MALDFTGERLIPEQAEGYTFWAHIYRYRFALEFVRGRTALDIACGEGYGTAALTTVTPTVIGIDCSPEAVEHARTKYRIEARVGSAEAIPLGDQSVEVVVSFETIEHVSSPAAFIRECHRVLTPGGLLVISTPNREVYSEGGDHNEFHCSELNETEFAAILAPYFTPRAWYGQCPTVGSWWRPRDLFVDGSPWMKTLVGRGVRRLFRKFFCPHLRFPPPAQLQQDAVRAVLGHDRPGAEWVNTYAIRRRNFRDADKPIYIVTLARRNDTTTPEPQLQDR